MQKMMSLASRFALKMFPIIFLCFLQLCQGNPDAVSILMVAIFIYLRDIFNK